MHLSAAEAEAWMREESARLLELDEVERLELVRVERASTLTLDRGTGCSTCTSLPGARGAACVDRPLFAEWLRRPAPARHAPGRPVRRRRTVSGAIAADGARGRRSSSPRWRVIATERVDRTKVALIGAVLRAAHADDRPGARDRGDRLEHARAARRDDADGQGDRADRRLHVAGDPGRSALARAAARRRARARRRPPRCCRRSWTTSRRSC